MTFQHLRIVADTSKRAAARTAASAPCAIQPLPGWNKRQFAIFLLQTAADIEHALLVQYLYAGYSLPSDDLNVDVIDPKTGKPEKDSKGNTVTTGAWAGKISQIAQEEMGHLMSIQCLLRALGGPIGFDREHFPYRSQLYPFPFTLERLTKNSLARYVVAEMPDPSFIDPKVLTSAEIEAIQERATRDTGGVALNHVGMLYDTLIKVVSDLKETDFRQDAIPYQPDDIENSWRANEKDNDKGIKVLPIRPVDSLTKLKDVACRALRIIARQGEGITKTTMKGRAADTMDNSHFMRFLCIYKQFPDGIDPAWPVATNPNTTVPPFPPLNQPSDPEAALQEQRNRGGRIVNPITLLWAHLFNVRYRILLAELHHYLLLRSDRAEQKAVRDRLVTWVFSEMNGRSGSSLMALAQKLPTGLNHLDQYNFPGFTAGAPFEIPYTFDLPDRGPDRWSFHRDLYEGSMDVVGQIETALKEVGQPVPDLVEELKTFENKNDGSGSKPPAGRIGYIDQHKDSEF